jgi:hypothetical protein
MRNHLLLANLRGETTNHNAAQYEPGGLYRPWYVYFFSMLITYKLANYEAPLTNATGAFFLYFFFLLYLYFIIFYIQVFALLLIYTACT